MRFAQLASAARVGAGVVLIATVLLPNAWSQAAPSGASHNVILFISDGLRAVSVTPESAPTMAKLRKTGVEFSNSHSLYPTVTTANASAIATGHYLGDTGDFGNTLYFGFPLWAHGGAPLTFLENDAVLGELNQHYEGNYLNEQSLVAAARKAGLATAVVGKVGPAMIQDAAGQDAASRAVSIVIDDSFGKDGGLPVPPDLLEAMRTNGIALRTPDGTTPDIEQEFYLANLVSKVVLPRLSNSGKPFFLVFWSRDPDISQHSSRESAGLAEPGINGPTGRAGVRNADDTLAMLLEAVHGLGLDDKTDIFVTADHGFVTVAKDSMTSTTTAARAGGAGAAAAGGGGRGGRGGAAANNGGGGELPSGFLAVDLANGLGHMPMFDPEGSLRPVDYARGGTPSGGSGLLGPDPSKPEVVVASNGGSDLIYLPQADAKRVAGDVVKVLLTEDYVSGIFVNDAMGAIPGTLPMSRINLVGTALTPAPAIVVSFRSFAGTCGNPLLCTSAISDTGMRKGQGNHGGFSRAETFNFMAAIGPDFKAGFNDEAPISNADIAPTLARLLGISLSSRGKLKGRVITESLKGGDPVKAERETVVSVPAENGLTTILNLQKVGSNVYFDAAGFAGRTVGLVAPGKQ